MARYTLPDGRSIKVYSERFSGPEGLFCPNLLGKQLPGLHQLVNKSISKVEDASVRAQLMEKIVVAGGTTLIKGFEERLKNELVKLGHVNTKIQTTPDAKTSAWLGASIVTTLSTFKNHVITKAEYQEIGPQVARRKCF